MKECLFDRNSQCFEDCEGCRVVRHKRISKQAEQLKETEFERMREEEALMQQLLQEEI